MMLCFVELFERLRRNAAETDDRLHVCTIFRIRLGKTADTAWTT
ncbi:MAG: hypothetical protein ACLT3Y_08225 [Ruminococcus callidus]